MTGAQKWTVLGPTWLFQSLEKEDWEGASAAAVVDWVRRVSVWRRGWARRGVVFVVARKVVRKGRGKDMVAAVGGTLAASVVVVVILCEVDCCSRGMADVGRWF